MHLLLHRTIVLALLPLLLAGCQIDTLDDPIIIPEIEREFYFDLREELYPSARELVIDITSVELEDCLNFTVRTSLLKRNRDLELLLLAVTPPADCINGAAPAQGAANLGQLGLGDYSLRTILQNEITSRATLRNTAEAYRISPLEETGFTWQHRELMRVPIPALWGYAATPNLADSAWVTSCQTAFYNLAGPLVTSPGYYHYFTLSDQQALAIKDQPATGFVKSFLRTFAGDPAAVANLVESLRQQAPAGATLAVYSGQGRVW